jgi:hypothetical protein
MKRALTFILAFALVTTPALAAGPGEKVEKPNLREAAAVAAEELVAMEAVENPLATPQEGTDPPVAGWRMAAAVGMIALGAGLIYNGIDLYDDTPDPFGRTKNSDAYLSMVVGGCIALFGVVNMTAAFDGVGFTDE